MNLMKVVYARDDFSQAYSHQETRYLLKRKGGGGGKSGGGSSSSSSSSSSGGSKGGTTSSSSSSSSSSASKGFTPGSVSGGSKVYGSSAGRGISTPYTVTSGAFAGRQAGGGTRSNIYSSGGYGSGYTSGYGNRGGLGGPVGGLGFPFIFWPVAFGAAGYGGYYGSRELNNDTERPGGGMTQYTLAPPANVTDAANNMFALYGDLNSVDEVFQTLVSGCGVSSTLASNFSINPNQTVQYYRGSSFALLLDNYDNMQPNISDTSGNTTEVTQPLAALPTTVDTSYLACLNSTVGPNVALIDAATSAALGQIAGLNILLALPALLIAFLLNVL
ncbi:hypothetical protein CBS101457_005453 [Exobasidium rhododendri]|nr:hypothetical protein CBS101457_005453 [Exobasidium rhododendri]